MDPLLSAAVLAVAAFAAGVLNAIEGVREGVFLAPDDLDRNPRARLAAFVVAPGMDEAAVLAVLRKDAADSPHPAG